MSVTVWQLPPPPTGMQWHRTDGWREEWLHSGMRPLLYGEGLERGDEVRHIRPTSGWGNVASLPWIAGVDAGRTVGGDYKSGFYIRTRRPLPQSAEPALWSECIDWDAAIEKSRASRVAFFAHVRTLDDASFVEAARDFHEFKEDWMTSRVAFECLDRELRLRELLARQSTGGRA